MGWPLLEEIIPARLADALDVQAGTGSLETVQAGPETPAELGVYVRVQVASGVDDGINDEVRVDVEAFAPTRAGAYRLAEDARQIMHSLGGRGIAADGGLIDTVTTGSRPRWVDYRNPNVDRVVATYLVVCRPIMATR